MTKTLLTLAIALASVCAVAGEWTQLPSLPDVEGFAGSYAGVSHGALLFAGGAKFPEKKPWEGGKKVWYDTVYVLERPNGTWKAAGKLPRALGYGVSVTHGDDVVCAGGSDRDRHYADVFRLEWVNGKLSIRPLPSLPVSIANCSGALVGDALYVAGGTSEPESKQTSHRAWKIDLSAKTLHWSELPSWPGRPRMLAVCAGAQGAFWLLSGVDLVTGPGGTAQRKYLVDAYKFEPRNGWAQVADLPHSVVAGPSPSPCDDKSIYLLGGDDGTQVSVQPNEHRGFGKLSLRYDLKSGKWHKGQAIPAPRATLPTAYWNSAWVLPAGEIRPGIRSPEVWSWSPGTME